MALDRGARRARRAAAAILTLVGAVNLPIIKFSVDWWNTLHQPASVFRLGGPDDRAGTAVAAAGDGARFHLLFLTLHLMAIRNEILRRRLARLTMIAAAEGDALAPAPDAGRRAMTAIPHLGFIVAAYAVAAVVDRGDDRRDPARLSRPDARSSRGCERRARGTPR